MSDTGRKTVMPNDSHLIAFRIRVGRVPARLLAKLAKQLSIAAAAGAAIAPLALFAHAHDHGLRVATRHRLRQAGTDPRDQALVQAHHHAAVRS